MDERERPMREERRTVTALSADVAGSTALAERLDPEDVRDVVGDAVRLMSEAVERFGGTVKDVAGDGIFALFGAPIAREDDVERAVLAGLEIQRSMTSHAERVRREHGVHGFGVRVGIECGLVVTGPVGGGSHVEYGATGDALNVAARLQTKAAVGAVLVGPAARGDVDASFSWSQPRWLELAGKAEPVQAAEALGVLPDRARGRTLLDLGAPLVGRDPEVAAAVAALERLETGGAGGLVITAEAGFGKTRLLEEIRARSPSGLRWLEASCTSLRSSTPYAPIGELLEAWHRSSGDARPPDDLLRPGRPEPRAAVAVLAGTADADAERAFAALSPEGRQLATVEGLHAFLVAATRESPVVLAIEDLHWCDPSSLQALERVLPIGGTDQIMFLFTTRPDTESPSADVLERAVRSGHVRRIELHALPSGSDRTLVASLVGDAPVPPRLLERLLETGAGNPFFLGELVRSLVEAGALAGSGAEPAIEAGAMPALPPTVERVLLARIDRLPDTDRDALTAASVLGRRFGADMLSELIGRDPGDSLERLTRAGLVRAEPPDHAFEHVLIQETAYGTLLRKRRRELHARAAATIGSGADPEQHAAVLARHHAGAGHTDHAVRWFVIAAERAEAVSAPLEAIADLDGALAAIDPEDAAVAELRLRRGRLRGRTGDHLGARRDLEDALRDAVVRGDRSLEMRCHDEIGFLVAGSADYRGSVDHLERALAIADELGDAGGRVSALSRLTITWANRLQLDRAERTGELALQAASASGDDDLVATALDAMKPVSLVLGRLDELERYGDMLRPLYARRNDRWLQQFVDLETGVVSVARGRLDEARARFDRSLALNRELHDDGNEPLHLAALGLYHRSRGDADAAIDVGRRAFDLARERGHEEWIAYAASELGSTLIQLGARARAADILRAGVEAAERSGAELHGLRSVGLLIRALVRTDPTAVDPILRSAETKLELVGVPPGEVLLFAWSGSLGIAAAWLRGADPERAAGTIAPIVHACVERSWPEAVVDASLVHAAALAALEDAEGAAASARLADEWCQRHGLPLYAWRAAAGAAAASPSDPATADVDRARAAAAALLNSIADASVRHDLEAEIDRVLTRGDSAWA